MPVRRKCHTSPIPGAVIRTDHRCHSAAKMAPSRFGPVLYPWQKAKNRMANNRLKIMSIVGARPNMMKVAPLLAELRRHDEIEPVLVHTGQHYDYSMSQVFFDQLGVPPPDYNLDAGSGPHYAQTAEIMRKFGDLVQQDRPDMLV